jgi:tetratricopeptide (TPR) repeat protein
MGFDKTKALNAAEKFLSQGKIPSAIQEYRKIVERDPADFAALNTLGDLYARTKNEKEAIGYFIRVADHYREQGFALKAIAMYKKISRLAPDAPGVAQHLARLYEQQGLYVEARAQYMTIADAATRDGRPVESLEALRRIADLDPRKVDIRTRLAEGYTREGMKQEAADAYAEAGELLLAAGKSRDALDAYRHAHQLAPASHAVLHGLVSASSAVGAVAEAAQVIEQAVAKSPGDLELRAMLARAYVEAQDAAAAERATDALVSAEHTNYPLWFEVARLYIKQSAVADGVRVLTRAVEPALTGKQERAVLALLEEALALDPEQIEALKLVLRIRTWQRDDESMRVTLERLADAARKHGQAEEERRALEHLVRLVPFDQGYHERLAQLGVEADAGDSRADLRTNARNEATQNFAPPAQSGAGEAHSVVANAASFGATTHAASSFESAAFESLAEVHDTAAFDLVSPSPEDAAPQVDATTHARAFEFERNSVAEVEGRERESKERESAITSFDPSASFADLNAEFQNAHEPAAPAAFEFAFERNGFDEPAPQVADSFAPDAAIAPDSAPCADEARLQSLLRQELESVDFYLEQGYSDIARDTLDMLERQYGANAETAVRRERLGAISQAPESPRAMEELHAVDEHGESPVDLSGVEYSHAERGARSAEEFRIDVQAFVVSAEEPARAADEFAASTTFLEIGTEEIAAEKIGTEEIAPEGMAAQTSHRASAARAVDPQLASFFGEFLDDETQEPAPSNDSDFETHYNLGVAYKEMCLWDEAIEQFQKAFDLTAPADGTPRYLECCNLLGHCLAQKGIPRAAVMWFKKALALPALTEDESQALRYDLASAYEQAGDIDRAIDTFSEVYGVDVSYRGVAERLRELQSRAVTSDR